MMFSVPVRIKLNPTNILGRILHRGNISVVLYKNGVMVHYDKMPIDQLETMWVTGVVFVKVPPFHKVIMVEESA